ncbi:MAG: hypothetical protein A2137_03830 [Chloroflexi bacterium RBG_16_58_8]|nr:MAG: hypothetical protein A2137_03830 [Chloroflexi bacterium RBG_16_58_8]
MKRKLIFALVAALLLAPWPVVYAHDDVLAGNRPVSIETAAPTTTPKLNVYRNAIGGVTPGDLFYIDITSSDTARQFILYLTNTDELAGQYRYLTLNIGVYMRTVSGGWEKVNTGGGETPDDTYLTMLGGQVNFSLPGYANYKITIDRGSFYSYGGSSGQGVILPKFYLTTG